MSCPTVIRVSTKTGPPGIGLPAGSAQQNGFAIVKDGATPYLYKLVEISQIGLPQALGITASPTFAGLTLSSLQAQAQGLAIVGINGQIQRVSIGSGLAIQNGAIVVTISGGGSGTVTSVGLSAPTGFSVSNSPVTGSGVLSFSFADGYSLLTTAKQQQWDAAAGLAATAVQGDDARLTNSREWSAETISQAEVEEGSSTTRRAFNSLRARQGVLAWWQLTSGAIGKLLAAASTQADARTALGLGTAATSAASDFATPSALATGLAGKADLVGGVIPSSQIPSIAITDYLGAVNSQSAMLALDGQKGDWCIRTDGLPNTGAWILSGNNPGSLSDWVKIPLPDVPVQSVNGQAGNIVLSSGDIGAATAAQGAKADSAIQPGNPALSDAREWNAATIDEAEAAAGTATTRRAFSALRVRQGILGWWNNSSDKTKLDGIATGATANSSDADLRDRSTHTGTQAASTIGDSTATGRAVLTANDEPAARSAIGAASSGAITGSGLTMATARLLGRTTAGSGAVEEIQVVGGSFTGNTLTLFDPASPGAIGGTTPASGTFTGLTLQTQPTPPAAPATGFRLFADASGRVSWRRGDGWTRTLEASGITGDRIWTFPDRSGTLALNGDITLNSNLSQIFNLGGSLGQEITAVNPGAGLTRLVYWNPANNRYEFLSLGSNLSISSGILNATGGGAVFPGYGVGNIIIPYDAQVGIGTAMTANTIYLTPFAVKKSITVNQVTFRVTTNVASSSFQYAIYGSSDVLPTGSPIVSSGNLSAAAATIVSHLPSTPFTLLSNQIYWTAINTDINGVGLQTLAAACTNTLNLVGTDGTATPLSTSAHVIRQINSAPFGSWPDVTSVTSSLQLATRGGIPQLRISALL